MENNMKLEQLETLIQQHRMALDKMEQFARDCYFDRTAEAYVNYCESLETRKHLAEYARILESDLAEAYTHFGDYLRQKKKYADAELCYENALQISQGLLTQDPASYRGNFVSACMKLIQFYSNENLYAKLGHLQKHILYLMHRTPYFTEKEIEDLSNECSRHFAGHEALYLELPSDVLPSADSASACQKKGEAYLKKGAYAAAEPYLWKAVELYEDLSRSGAENYDTELLGLYQKISVLQDQLSLSQNPPYPLSLPYVITKFTVLYKKVTVISKNAADSSMASFCGELLGKGAGLFKINATGYELFETILEFAARKDSPYPAMLIGQLCCRLGERYLETSYGKDCAKNVERALWEAIRIFDNYMEQENPTDFSYSLNAYELLAKLHQQQEGEEKAAETLLTLKRVIKEKMRINEAAFAPYLAKYYYHIGYDLADRTDACREPFAKARDLFLSFLNSDRYTDAEKEVFQSYLDRMDSIISDIYLVYGTSI